MSYLGRVDVVSIARIPPEELLVHRRFDVRQLVLHHHQSAGGTVERQCHSLRGRDGGGE